MKNSVTTTKAIKVIEYTNKRLETWYVNAKEEYGINGFGVCKYDESSNSIVIEYCENGRASECSIQDWHDESIEYSFDVWMEFGECAEC
jgi:hypothetical protein